MDEALSAADLEMIVYFVKEKGDIRRWCDFEKKEAMVRKELPYLMFSIERKEIAERMIGHELRLLQDRL